MYSINSVTSKEVHKICYHYKDLIKFYDVNGKLTMAEAMVDVSLVRRFHNFFTLFYGRKDLSGDDIREWLSR